MMAERCSFISPLTGYIPGAQCVRETGHSDLHAYGATQGPYGALWDRIAPTVPTIPADHPSRAPHVFELIPNSDDGATCAVCATVRDIGPHVDAADIPEHPLTVPSDLGPAICAVCGEWAGDSRHAAEYYAETIEWDELRGSEYGYVAELTGRDGQRYRAIVAPDDFGFDAADYLGETPAEIVTWQHDTGSRHGIGDRGPTDGETDALRYGGWTGLVRHLERNGALVTLPVSGYSHSGQTIWVASAPGETSPFDSAGWDSGQWGFVTVNRDRWRDDYAVSPAAGHPYGRTPESDARADADAVELIPFGDKPNAPMMTRAEATARYAVAELDDILTGNVWQYRIERLETWQRVRGHFISPTESVLDSSETREEWETVDSCGGFVGDAEYCQTEALSALRAAAVGEGN